MNKAARMHDHADTLSQLHKEQDCSQVRQMSACSIHLLSALSWNCTSDWEISPRQCSDDFLFIPLHGEIIVSCGDKRQHCAVGQCILIAEGTAHSITHANDDSCLEVLALHLRIHDADGLSLCTRMDNIIFPIDIHTLDNYRSLVSLHNHDHLAGNQFAQILIRQLLYSWVLDSISFTIKPIADARIRHALNIIHQHYSGDLHINSLAKEVGLGVVQFRKLFRASVQQSPKLYIAHFRLRLAAAELCASHESIKHIAEQFGFADEHYFHNSFKRFYQCTPAQYRERVHI